MVFKNTLLRAKLIRRYKRFLADVILDNGTEMTVYCPNTGSMRSCSAPGSEVCISHSDNSDRKYPYTLEMIRVGGSWVGVNTGLTNLIVAEAIKHGAIEELKDFDSLQREVTVTPGTRLDILLTGKSGRVFIEVKNCSMVEEGTAMFPDAVTKRGTKHLEELAGCVKRGDEAVIFYLVQRTDASVFRPAVHIDRQYAETLVKVHQVGVKILVYQAAVTPESISISGKLPFKLQ